MADADSKGSFRRFFLYFLAAVPIAALIVAVATAMESGPSPKVDFDLKMKISGEDIRANGTLYLYDDGFSFDTDRLSFSGTVTGDQVKIAGKVTNAERSQTRDFGASGRLANNQLSATVNGDRGSRIGSLKLELLNR